MGQNATPSYFLFQWPGHGFFLPLTLKTQISYLLSNALGPWWWDSVLVWFSWWSQAFGFLGRISRMRPNLVPGRSLQRQLSATVFLNCDAQISITFYCSMATSTRAIELLQILIIFILSRINRRSLFADQYGSIHMSPSLQLHFNIPLLPRDFQEKHDCSSN